jgi:flagellar basal-body rod protein FlgB
MEKLFNENIRALTDIVEVRAKRHRVILSNVANIDAPGFKPSELSFKNELQSAKNVRITQTNPRHLTGSKGVQGSLQFDIKESDEQVKLDAEMANLSENQVLYTASVEILARKFKAIQAALRETK